VPHRHDQIPLVEWRYDWSPKLAAGLVTRRVAVIVTNFPATRQAKAYGLLDPPS
jgi:hypothetical protein